MEVAQYATTEFGRARQIGGRHGYVAYFPAPVPRSLDLPGPTISRLANAEGSLGRLAGIGRLLPKPELLVKPYLLREALASTRIEGTQASLAEILETDATGGAPNADVEEVLNYIEAMRWGIGRLDRLPLSTRLFCEIHRRLMAGVRGRERAPGELRRTQNWIGPPGSTVETADFVPPPPSELAGLLKDWETFAHEEPEMPLLIQNALLHSQFETIHPFLDGNGRLGRLLIVFLLIARGRLPGPLLYLSSYLERRRDQYYAALQAIRESGDPVPWLELFLAAIQVEAEDAVKRGQRLVELRDRYFEAASSLSSQNVPALVDLICENPLITARAVETRLGVSRPTALRLLTRMEEQGVLRASGVGQRGQRRYVAPELMDVFLAGDRPE